MVIRLGAGKKRMAHVGRDFVRPLNKAQSVYDVIDAWKGITNKAKGARTLKRVKVLNERLIAEMALEKVRLDKSKDTVLAICELRATKLRKVSNFVLAELDLPTSKRRKLAELLDADTNLYRTHSVLSNNMGVLRVELIDLLRKGIERTKSLNPSALARAPIIAQNEKAIIQLIKILQPLKGEFVKIDPNAVHTLKYVNDQLVKQLLGNQYSEYQSLVGKATKNIPHI